MDIHQGARKHGVPDDAIRHAVDNAVTYGPVDEELPGFVVIGPDLSGNLLEVIVVTRENQEALAIHAMPLRPKYRYLLP